MSAKPILFATISGLLFAAAASAQPPMMHAPGAPVSPPSASGPAAALMANGFTPLSSAPVQNWSSDGGPLPVGGNGPIGQELYSLVGITMANGDGIFGAQLDGGFMIEGGGRALSFNVARDAAWTAKLGLTFQTNRTDGATPIFDFFGQDARLRQLLRVSGVFALGRDWFLQGASPFGDGRGALRAGFDLGVRWGTERVNFDVVNDPIFNTFFFHRSDNYGGVVLGWHANIEVPMEAWVWFGGIRGEYGYNWSELLPGQNSNIHDVNLLFTTGFRY